MVVDKHFQGQHWKTSADRRASYQNPGV